MKATNISVAGNLDRLVPSRTRMAAFVIGAVLIAFSMLLFAIGMPGSRTTADSPRSLARLSADDQAPGGSGEIAEGVWLVRFHVPNRDSTFPERVIPDGDTAVGADAGSAAVQRQEELKERWLERRGLTGAGVVTVLGTDCEELCAAGFEPALTP